MSDNESSPILNVDTETIEKLKSTLIDQTIPITQRIRTVFTLRHINTHESIDVLKEALTDPSALLAHEVAYCLGQMQNPYSVPYLIETLENESLDSMVRHEAGESLGAIGDTRAIEVLEKYKDHPIKEIAETCVVALDLLSWSKNKKLDKNNLFCSVDPAPPNEEKSIEELTKILCDKELTIFKRYRALFALRNINTKESALAICEAFDDESALFKHELAYVLGQMQYKETIPALSKVLQDTTQHAMVRHEAAEAIGNIADDDTIPLLQKYLVDEVIAVKESCYVALDIQEYNNSNDLQYADGLSQTQV